MHFLAIALLAILAGTLLLAKAKKEQLGKFFHFVSWFFIVVGFAGFLAGGTCALVHHVCPAKTECRTGMHQFGPNDQMPGAKCCPEGMQKNCGNMKCPMKGDSARCPMHKMMNEKSLPVPQAPAGQKPAKP